MLEGRTNTPIFRTLSVSDVIEKLLGEWQKKSPAFARALDFDLSSLDHAKYPVRETLLQFHESDADFIRQGEGGSVAARTLKRILCVVCSPPTFEHFVTRADVTCVFLGVCIPR